MKDFLQIVLATLKDLLDTGRAFAVRLIGDFRKSDKYFKYKFAVISAYVVIAILTLLIFIPPGELNQINAEVILSKAEIIGGRYFLVSNLSTDDWKDITLTLNKTFVTHFPSLGAGKKMPFFVSSFADRSGHPPGPKTALHSVRIECSEGVFERDLQEHP